MKIWIVDDDELVHLLVNRIITKGNLDADLESFFDGKDAFDKLKERANESLPDVLILDINMPLYDGWYLIEEFVKLNKEVRQNVKIYICSSSIAPFDKERAENCEYISEFIEKPLTLSKLQEIMKLT